MRRLIAVCALVCGALATVALGQDRQFGQVYGVQPIWPQNGAYVDGGPVPQLTDAGTNTGYGTGRTYWGLGHDAGIQDGGVADGGSTWTMR